MKLISAADLAAKEMPEVKYHWGDLLRSRGRLSVIGAPKTAKSFFVMQMGLHIATGTKFLNYETRKGTVLYLNLEISQEKLQERVVDMMDDLGIESPDGFITASPADGMALDTKAGYDALEALISEVTEERGALDVLIIDPRRQSMAGDENQSEILTRWCTGIDMLKEKYGFATVIVHHTGKATTGAGRGSSVFDGWLDTMLWLEPSTQANWEVRASNKVNLALTEIATRGRDTAEDTLVGTFSYPTWSLSDNQLAQQQTKVEQCMDFVLEQISDGSMHSLNQIRREAYRTGHSDYAFKQVLLRLRGQTVLRPDRTRQGNWKMIGLLTPETTA